MPGNQPSAEETPLTDELEGRVDKLQSEKNLGAGDEEPDPVSAENPPKERREGDKSRKPD